MKTRIPSIICAVLAVILAAVLIVCASIFGGSKTIDKDDFSEVSRKISELESQKKQAEKELLALNNQVNSIEKKATVSVMFCGMSTSIYEDAFPIMQKYGIKGTIVMTGDRLPGSPGILNDAQILELTGAGWTLIPGITADDGDFGISSSSKWISDYGYDFNGSFFTFGEFYPDHETAMSSMGYYTFVSYVKNGKISDRVTSSTDGLWQLTAIGYKNTGPSSMNSLVEEYGNIALVVDFETDESLFDESKLSSMLDYLKKSRDKGILAILSPGKARDYRQDMDNRIASAYESISPSIEKNRQQMDEINSAISSVYENYNKSHK